VALDEKEFLFELSLVRVRAGRDLYQIGGGFEDYVRSQKCILFLSSVVSTCFHTKLPDQKTPLSGG
jgi:hypothetical protein